MVYNITHIFLRRKFSNYLCFYSQNLQSKVPKNMSTGSRKRNSVRDVSAHDQVQLSL